MISTKLKPDTIGILASSLCLIHCISTPFLFLAKVCSTTCCADAPVWWQLIDYFFLIVSFSAIFYTTQNSTKRWVIVALWSTWLFLLLGILNETFQVIAIREGVIYIPGLLIIGLHFYNLKFCKCAPEDCLVESKKISLGSTLDRRKAS